MVLQAIYINTFLALYLVPLLDHQLCSSNLCPMLIVSLFSSVPSIGQDTSMELRIGYDFNKTCFPWEDYVESRPDSAEEFVVLGSCLTIMAANFLLFGLIISDKKAREQVR